MVSFNDDMVSQAVAKRANEQKWTPDRTSLVAGICAWYAAHPGARIDYEDGRPNPDMQEMIDGVSHDTGLAAGEVLTSFGAAHCLLCDTVPGFRPALYSAWDRHVAGDHHG